MVDGIRYLKVWPEKHLPDEHYSNYAIPWDAIEHLCRQKEIDLKLIDTLKAHLKLDTTCYVKLDITSLMDAYHIDGAHLFQRLHNFYKLGPISYPEAKRILEKEDTKDHFHMRDNYYMIDWYAGRPFKMGFRISMEHKQLFALQLIDERTAVGTSYLFLLTMLAEMKPVSKQTCSVL